MRPKLSSQIFFRGIKFSLVCLLDSIRLFMQKRGSVLAAGASFYFLLTIVPLSLLMTRLVGMVLGNLVESHQKVIDMAIPFIPGDSLILFIKLKEILKGALFAGEGFTLLNLIFLAVSTFSIFNTIGSGLFLITGEKRHISFKKHFTSLAIIGTTVICLTLFFLLPNIVHWAFDFMTRNSMVALAANYVDFIDPMIQFLHKVNGSFIALLKSDAFRFLTLGLYFSWLYKWFFARTISFRQSMLGGFVFVILLLVGKEGVLFYFRTIREGLLRSYGDYYTYVLGIMWIYFVMCFFFFGACLCHTLGNSQQIRT